MSGVEIFFKIFIMKKFIILLLASVFLVSCGANNEEKIAENIETNSGVIQSEISKLSPENQKLLDDFMKEYEEKLRSTGEFSEEIIQEAIVKIREEKVAELLSN